MGPIGGVLTFTKRADDTTEIQVFERDKSAPTHIVSRSFKQERQALNGKSSLCGCFSACSEQYEKQTVTGTTLEGKNFTIEATTSKIDGIDFVFKMTLRWE